MQPRSSKSTDRRDKSSGGSVWHQQYDVLAPQANVLEQRAQVTSCESALPADGTLVSVGSAPPDATCSRAIGLNAAACAALFALMSILRCRETHSDFGLQALLQWG
ncbi:MAG: hypothetical protein H7203_04350 [Rhizobacter sp.]|nr:hypothetical protein [Burkholderiales bacterium]